MVGAFVIQGSKLSGGYELGAVWRSLGPHGANSETGRTDGAFLASCQAEASIVDYGCEYVTADQAYDGHDFVQFVITSGAIPVIPARSNPRDLRGCDEYL